jgi:leader peptidase (prepilin peptidase) / N-methyltransferase
MLRVFATILAALAGLAFGSFLNVCVSRWPRQMSVVKPRSYCLNCGRTLRWWENIPLVSWLALRGHCRTCRAWIGWRHPVVELAIGAIWAHEAWKFLGAISRPGLIRYDLNYALTIAIGDCILCWMLVALAVLDAENLWLPDRLTLPGIALGIVRVLILAALQSLFWFWQQNLQAMLERTLGAILVAAGLILLIRLIYWLVRRREGIGWGDAKLMAMIAAWLGLPLALLSFALGVVLGALFAVILLAVSSPRKGPGVWALQKLPLGTFLCIGGIAGVLWGQSILDAYLQWARF